MLGGAVGNLTDRLFRGEQKVGPADALAFDDDCEGIEGPAKACVPDC